MNMDEVMPWTDGTSLVPLARGHSREEPVLIEYAAEASYSPLVAIRRGKWKFIRCLLDPDQLFDVENDPHEMHNLASNTDYRSVYDELSAEADRRWDLHRFDREVRENQQRRLTVYEALRSGRFTPWDHHPVRDESNRFMRNHMDLNEVEERNRFPRGE